MTQNQKFVLGAVAVVAILALIGVAALLMGFAPNSIPAVPTQEVAQSDPTESPTEVPPTPMPTAMPTALPPTQPAACPATAEAKVSTGVDVQRLGTEPCAWVWRGVPPATIAATCPSGFVCTFDVVDDIVVVHLGVNQTATIRAGTWRYIGGYPSNDDVHNVCALYQKEKNFGLIEVPSFQVRFQAVSDGTTGPFGPQSCP